MVRAVRRLVLASTLGVFVVLAGCHGVPPANPEFLNMVDLRADFYLTSDAAAGPGYLVRDKAAPADSHMRAADLQAAVAAKAQSYQNPLGGPSWEFSTRAPVGQALYLNLSAPIAGTLFISNQASMAGGDRGFQSSRIRIEAYQAGARLGGVEYLIDGTNSAAGYYQGVVQPGWLPVKFMFWPEAAKVHADQPLTFKVSLRAGHTDLVIGTGGTHASYIRLFYFEDDPIAGALYLLGGKFVSEGNLTSPSEAPNSGGKGSETGAPMAPGSAGLPVLLGLAVPFLRPRKQKMHLLALVLLSGAFAGCLGGGAGPAETTPDTTGATVHATVVPKEGPTTEGKGDIEGVVRTREGFGVKAAHISLLGTSRFTKTDAGGRFRLADVAADGYVLRVDADEYQSLQKEIVVVAGNTTRLEISLIPVLDRGANSRPHIHPDWQDATSVVLHDKAQTLAGCTRTDALGAGGACLYDVVLDPAARVFPGTGRVDVQLRWNSNQTLATRELGLIVSTGVALLLPNDEPTPLNDNSYYFIERPYLARGSGDAFHVNVFPNEADPGHQKFTNWRFQIVTPDDDLYLGSGQALGRADISVNIRIVIHKTVIPYEPPHPDRWQGRDSLPLWKSLDPIGYDVSYTQNQQTCSSCYLWEVVPTQGGFVPPGTLEIRGFVKVTRTTSLSQATLTMYYKGADKSLYPSGDWLGFSKAATMGGTPDNVSFVIKPTEAEADQFYQGSSYWRLFFAISSGTEASENLRFKLTAVAVKDPAYDPA